MKRITAFLLVLIVSSVMIFAMEHSVSLGAGYHYGQGTVAKPKKSFDNRYLKNSAVELQIGYDLEFDNHLVVYDNIGLGYGLDLESKGTDTIWDTANKWEKSDDKTWFLEENLGTGYSLHFDNMRLVAGGGVHFEMILDDLPDSSDIKMAYFGALGVNILVEGNYYFNDNISAFASIKPNANLLSFWKTTKQLSCTAFAPSFSGTAIVGVSYKF